MDGTETGYESTCLIHLAQDKSPVLSGVDPTKYLPVSIIGRKFLGCWNIYWLLMRHHSVVEINIK
jgi:hypothetical protein